MAEAETGSIGVLVEGDGLRLMYAFAAHDGTKVSANEHVPFVHTVFDPPTDRDALV